MNKKTINTHAISNELAGGASLFFAKPDVTPSEGSLPVKIKEQNKPTQESTSQTTQPLEISRKRSSDYPREQSRDLPSRDDIQEFSFGLRDELKVKVQAEVPHQWQGRLEDMARQINVKKLELYRFIIGDFLGEVKPGKG